jgi:L-ribulose-5-phosphate 3-epimerase
MMTRREWMAHASAAAAGLACASAEDTETAALRIGACDWSLGKRQHLEAFDVAAAIGLEGVQVSFSSPGSDFDLRDAAVRAAYFAKVEATGIQISSLGMGILNQRPYATDPEAEIWVAEMIDTMATMRDERPDLAPALCLIAFFSEGDINGKPALMEATAERFRKVMPRAEEAGVILGIESLMSAEDHLKIIDAVGSPNLQVYYDSANSARMGYDIYEEVRQLGGARICEVHCKENDRQLLGQGPIDFKRWRESLVTEAGYRGWLIIEGSQPQDQDVVTAYQANRAFLEKVFRG